MFRSAQHDSATAPLRSKLQEILPPKFLRAIDGNFWNSRLSHLMSATTNLDGDAIVMAENPRPLEQMLHLTEEEPSAEQLGKQGQKAQEPLLPLKRQQEENEKEKRETGKVNPPQEEMGQGRGGNA